MSNIGLNSIIYNSLNDYIDLLSTYIIEFNYLDSQGKDYHNNNVESFFRQLNDTNACDPNIQIILSFLERYYSSKKKILKKEIETILNLFKDKSKGKDLANKIQSIIDILGYYKYQSYERINGR
ncbi:MAG: hypothetical protein JW973_15440 [Bacteroidales bacterium]|nr:hypothetical protein [Bacteroidales bacterium]